VLRLSFKRSSELRLAGHCLPVRLAQQSVHCPSYQRARVESVPRANNTLVRHLRASASTVQARLALVSRRNELHVQRSKHCTSWESTLTGLCAASEALPA